LEPLAEKILQALSKSHRFFAEILEPFRSEEFARIARAIGMLSEQGKIGQDEEGKYQLVERNS
jgi:hypothetical protein